MDFTSTEGVGAGTYAERLFRTMDLLEYRRVVSAEDFEAVERLRYRAYALKKVLPIGAKNLLDDMDFDRNAMVFAIYLHGDIAATIRLHRVTSEEPTSPSRVLFPEAVDDLLGRGLKLIDSARFAVAPELAGEYPELPLLTVRLSPMAAIHFDADRVLQPVRPAHAAFYRRYCFAQTLVPPKVVEAYGFELMLLVSGTREIREKAMRRMPAFRSTASERRLMFAASRETGMPPLTILPTARIASRIAEVRGPDQAAARSMTSPPSCGEEPVSQ